MKWCYLTIHPDKIRKFDIPVEIQYRYYKIRCLDVPVPIDAYIQRPLSIIWFLYYVLVNAPTTGIELIISQPFRNTGL